MISIPVADGELFRKNVEIHSGDEWPHVERLAAATGILVGRDGPRSRGIYCATCRFGFRREFGPYPLVEARTSLANDFMDEAHRRNCPHWREYVSHPDAFGRPRPAAASPAAEVPSVEAWLRTCGRCGESANALFRCLHTRVCFRCLGEVLQFTGGYRGFRSLMTVEAVPQNPDRRRRGREPGSGLCRTCHAYGKVIRIHGRNYCRPCATAKVEKLLAK